MQSLSKFQCLFVEIDKLIQKFIWKLKGPPVAKTILKKKNKVGGLILPSFKTYYKAIVIKVVWYWHKNRNTDQWNSIECPERNPYVYGQFIFNKGTKTIQWGKNSLFNRQCWDNGISICRR